MNKEEIRENISMREVLARYGFSPNRAGFINCPFHNGDRDASLKVYERDFYCFGCGAHGDIFDFVMKIEPCSFKTAFSILGGTYETKGFAADLARYRAEKSRQMRVKKQMKKQEALQLNLQKMEIYKTFIEKSKPLSAVWCDCYNALQIEQYRNEVLRERR